jgi:uncharacterized membrane protein
LKTPYILIFVGFVCFGIGMLLGQALGYSVWWVVALVAMAIGCMALLHVPIRCKKLPVRREHLKLVSSRKSVRSR